MHGTEPDSPVGRSCRQSTARTAQCLISLAVQPCRRCAPCMAQGLIFPVKEVLPEKHSLHCTGPDQSRRATLQKGHRVRLDSSEELQELLLAEGAANWRSATKRHEDEAAQFGGVVANPDSRKSRGMRAISSSAQIWGVVATVRQQESRRVGVTAACNVLWVLSPIRHSETASAAGQILIYRAITCWSYLPLRLGYTLCYTRWGYAIGHCQPCRQPDGC